MSVKWVGVVVTSEAGGGVATFSPLEQGFSRQNECHICHRVDWGLYYMVLASQTRCCTRVCLRGAHIQPYCYGLNAVNIWRRWISRKYVYDWNIRKTNVHITLFFFMKRCGTKISWSEDTNKCESKDIMPWIPWCKWDVLIQSGRPILWNENQETFCRWIQ